MSFTRYPDLPAELRVEVRKFALKAWCTDTNDHIAALACVNKEWQFDIERFLFRNLILQSYPQHSSDEESDLRCFDDIVRGVRRSFVKSIRLIIDPDGKEYFSDSHWYAVSCHSIHYLLRILEQWGMAGTGKNVIDVSLYWGMIDEGGMWPAFELAHWPIIPIVGSLEVSGPPGGYTVPLAPSSLFGICRKLPSLTELRVAMYDAVIQAEETLEILVNIPGR